MDVGVPEFYTFLFREKYPNLVSTAAEIMAMFGSTYVCEQFFSSMKINKSALRSRLTDEHLHATLRLATTRDFKPDVDFLVAAKSAGRVRWRLSKTELLNYNCESNYIILCNLYYLLLLLHFVVSKSTAARRLSDILQCGPHPQMSLRPLL